jgi:hypothetical protein
MSEKQSKRPYPPVFFLGRGCGWVFCGVLGGPWGGFCLSLHVENDVFYLETSGERDDLFWSCFTVYVLLGGWFAIKVGGFLVCLGISFLNSVLVFSLQSGLL